MSVAPFPSYFPLPASSQICAAVNWSISCATGGTRNTSIVLNIGKFFEDVNITNTDGRDLRQLQDAVLESINRSLEIATSAGR